MIIDKFLKVRGPISIDPKQMNSISSITYGLSVVTDKTIHITDAEVVYIETGFSTGEKAYKKADEVIRKKALGEKVVLDFGQATSPYRNIVLIYDDILALWIIRYDVLEDKERYLYTMSIIDRSVLTPAKADTGNKDVKFFMFMQNKSDCTVAIEDFKPLLPPSLMDIPGYRNNIIMESMAKLHMAMESFSIMNCKNIYLQKENPPKKRQKKVMKNKKRLPLFSYHVVKIDPGKVKKKADEPNIGTGSHKRLHLCRGHVRRYTPENPLFGRYVGSVWIEAHARGGKEPGLVTKSYELATKDTEEPSF